MAEQSLRSRAAEALRLTRDKKIGRPDAESVAPSEAVQISPLSFKLDPETRCRIEAEQRRNEELLGLER
jgi:hypothetical protein